MDLVAGVRKEGSRGGRADFKWEDVKEDQHRENYLGHSLMAPVGRWQKNRDLSWYANSSSTPASTAAADARAEEIRRIKEAEQDALSAALGYPVAPRPSNNANLQPLGEKEVRKALKEAADDENDGDGGRGMGFDGGGGVMIEGNGVQKEIMEGMSQGRGGLSGGDGALVRRETAREERSEKRRRSRSRERRRRSRSRERRHRRYDDDGRSHRRHRSRSRERERDTRRRRSRSRSYERRRDDDRYPRQRRERSYSPPRRRRDDSRERGDRGHERRR